MEKTYKYKKQGNGLDSWEVSEWDGKVLLNKYMVFEDPAIEKKSEIELLNEKIAFLELRIEKLETK